MRRTLCLFRSELGRLQTARVLVGLLPEVLVGLSKIVRGALAAIKHRPDVEPKLLVIILVVRIAQRRIGRAENPRFLHSLLQALLQRRY